MEQNKNKMLFLTLAALLMLFLAFAFSGCVPPVPEVISVTGVSITEEDQSIKVDETLKLTVVVTPEDADNKTITWESDNPDVATVDENGLVTALKSGVANITVTTEDGAFSDTIKITVTKPYTPSTPAVKKYEVDFQVVENLAGGIGSRQGNNTDLSYFKVEIFTDAEKNTKKTDTLTDATGKASVKLPNGEYWFSVTKDGYLDYPPETFSSVQRQTQPGYFKVEGADVANIPPIPMQKTYILTMAVEPTGSGNASDDTNNGPYTAGTVVTISADAAEGYNTSSVSVPLPDNTSTGDLVIVIFATDGDMGTVTPQDEFQAITIKTGSGYPGIAAFYKILDENENDDFTCTLENKNEWIARSLKITGNRNTDPIGNSSDAMINNSSTLDVPGINGASCSLLIAAAVNNKVTFDTSYPSEMDWIFNVTNNTIDLFFQISEENRDKAGNTGTRTFSLWDDSYSGYISGIMFEILSPNSAYQPGA